MNNCLQQYVDSIKKEILEDTVLSNCKSFSELHNYCDANVLGDIESRSFANTEEMIDFANNGMNIIDQWLKGKNNE